MKTNSQNRRGIALVVVLVFLVLLSVFIVGFFSNSQDELTAAQSFTGEVTAQQLAESAVSVVMGQIREATTRKNGAWGSQPGMIRVYRNGDAASDKADAFFKLYSSNDMIVSGNEITSYDPATEIPEKKDSWSGLPALWTDLNQPVQVPPPPGTPTNAGSTLQYPILDPAMAWKIDGISTGRGAEGMELTSSEDPKIKSQTARMPVRWLYVLRDGSMTAPAQAAADGTQAKWLPGQRAPSASNPIVGRVAFWTDDESSKLNINTAGGYQNLFASATETPRRSDGQLYSRDDYAGCYWDTPRVFTEFDQGILDVPDVTKPAIVLQGGLGTCQPVHNEFQRYPGHPATTSLGVVFRDKILLNSGQLALLNPRLQYSYDTGKEGKRNRGSNYGTERIISKNEDPMDPRTRRLYSSVDELFFGQKPVMLASGARRVENNTEISDPTSKGAIKEVLTAPLLDRLRFFLTAHSRAPEINLFGRPRVTLWPVWEVLEAKEESTLWNGSDRLLAFCSTVGPQASTTSNPKVDEKDVHRFLFQRKNAYSDTDDALIGRNTTLFNILRNQTDQPFPGFGGQSFKDKFAGAAPGVDRDQVLVEMIDYIRCANLRDSTRDKDIMKYGGNQASLDTTAEIVASEKFKFAPRGLVIPLRFGDSVGFGRFPSFSEAALVLYHSGYTGTNGKRYLRAREYGGKKLIVKLDASSQERFIDSNEALLNGNDPKDMAKAMIVKKNLVRAFMVFETFNPMQGFAPTTSANGSSLNQRGMKIEATGLSQFTLGGRPLGFLPDSVPRSGNPDNLPLPNNRAPTLRYARSSANAWGGRNSGGSEGFAHTLLGYYDDSRKWHDMWKRNIITRDPGAPSNPLKDSAPAPVPTGHALDFYEFQTTSDVTDPGDLGGSEVPGLGFPADPRGESAPVQLGGATVGIKIGFEGLAKAVHTLALEFPAATVPIPTDQLWAHVKTANGGTAIFNDAGGFESNGSSIPPVPPIPVPATWNSRTADTADAKSFAGRLRGRDGGKHPNDKTSRGNSEHGVFGNGGEGYYHLSDTTPSQETTNRWKQILQPGDVVRSMVFGKGDIRVSMITTDTKAASAVFTPHANYQKPEIMHAQSLRMADMQLYYPDYNDPSHLANVTGQTEKQETRFGNIARLPSGVTYPSGQAADYPTFIDGKEVNGVFWDINKKDSLGDFDTGIGNLPDGPFCNKADEGNLAWRYEIKDANGVSYDPKHWAYPIPYFTWLYEEAFDTFFSPNRQVPSAVVFGSLIAGKTANWRTLAFSPNPASGSTGTSAHPGRLGTKDYLWLDLFTMPVVEPYAISEPFSTAGKVNMNYQIVPFTNIKRSTAMRGALHAVRVSGFPQSKLVSATTKQVAYKTGFINPKNSSQWLPLTENYRYRVDRDETLKAFDYFFADYGKIGHEKGFFKSAAQICDFYLYPTLHSTGGDDKPLASWSALQKDILTWWTQNLLTGDNVREKPYGDLYPRLTTKSNTYCVHVRAQALRQASAPDAASAATWYLTWNEKRDRMIGEYRGASIIERYIDPQDRRFDPNDTSVPTGAGINMDTGSVEEAYRFRVLNTKRFAP